MKYCFIFAYTILTVLALLSCNSGNGEADTTDSTVVASTPDLSILTKEDTMNQDMPGDVAPGKSLNTLCDPSKEGQETTIRCQFVHFGGMGHDGGWVVIKIPPTYEKYYFGGTQHEGWPPGTFEIKKIHDKNGMPVEPRPGQMIDIRYKNEVVREVKDIYVNNASTFGTEKIEQDWEVFTGIPHIDKIGDEEFVPTQLTLTDKDGKKLKFTSDQLVKTSNSPVVLYYTTNHLVQVTDIELAQ